MDKHAKIGDFTKKVRKPLEILDIVQNFVIFIYERPKRIQKSKANAISILNACNAHCYLY